MRSETTMIAEKCRLQEWAAQIRDCQNRRQLSVRHLDDTDRAFLDDLLPWSPNLPANCRKPGKDEIK